MLKAELNNDQGNEIATKAFIASEFDGLKAEISNLKNEVKTELKQFAFMLKLLLIILPIYGLTLFNPAFVRLIELAFK
jgi:hypothetical protein